MKTKVRGLFRQAIAVAFALAVASTSAVSSAAAEDDESTPATTSVFRIGTIKQIVIEQQGSANEKGRDAPHGCAHFHLTQNEVANFFRITRAITQVDYVHTLTYTLCAVSGKLTLADGRTGEWLIKEVRGGYLKLSDGTEFYLYCAKCRSKKFVR